LKRSIIGGAPALFDFLLPGGFGRGGGVARGGGRAGIRFGAVFCLFTEGRPVRWGRAAGRFGAVGAAGGAALKLVLVASFGCGGGARDPEKAGGAVG